MNPKDIDWISGAIEAKISTHKPDDMVLSNDEIDHSAAEAAFVAIFVPKTGETFVWFHQYQVKQTARKVSSCKWVWIFPE